MYHQSQKTKLHSILLALSFLTFSCMSIAHAAPPWDQTRKLLASDGTEFDWFGRSVALSGNTAVIGAVYDDDNGIDSGSAYVFDVTTGNQLFKLLPLDGATEDFFGSSVAISGNLAVIGALEDDDNGSASGSAYAFDVTTGQQIFKLLPSDGANQDIFGVSVALSGNLAVIGADRDDDNGFESGSAYVFDVTTGQQLFKLLPTDGTEFDFFGISVALSGNLAVIGADRDDDKGFESGSAYVFDITTGQQLFKLLATDGAAGDLFGNSVAVFGNTTVIGAFGDDDNGDASGSAYVFQQRTTNYLAVKPIPLRAGKFGTFSFVEGLPDETSWLLYSTDGLGKTFINQLNVTVDIANPKIAIGPGLTDANGNRQVIRQMPTVTAPTTVWFQAVQHNNVTNFFRTQILP